MRGPAGLPRAPGLNRQAHTYLAAQPHRPLERAGSPGARRSARVAGRAGGALEGRGRPRHGPLRGRRDGVRGGDSHGARTQARPGLRDVPGGGLLQVPPPSGGVGGGAGHLPTRRRPLGDRQLHTREPVHGPGAGPAQERRGLPRLPRPLRGGQLRHRAGHAAEHDGLHAMGRPAAPGQRGEHPGAGGRLRRHLQEWRPARHRLQYGAALLLRARPLVTSESSKATCSDDELIYQGRLL